MEFDPFEISNEQNANLHRASCTRGLTVVAKSTEMLQEITIKIIKKKPAERENVYYSNIC